MPPSPNDTRLCLVPDCGNGINARGLCKTHWGRARTLNLLGGSGPVDAGVLESAWLARESRQAAKPPSVEASSTPVQVTATAKRSSVGDAFLEAELATARQAASTVRVQLSTLRGGLVRVLDLAEGSYSDEDLLRQVATAARPPAPTKAVDAKLERYVVTTLFDRLISEADELAGTDIELLKVLRAVVLGEVPAA